MTGNLDLQHQTVLTVKASQEPFIQDKAKLGWIVIFIFVGSITLWSLLAPLSTGASLYGQVIIEGERISLQQLEGGMVEKIHVSNGTFVEKGDLIIEFSSVAEHADKNFAEAQLLAHDIRKTRLIAERERDEILSFPDFSYSSVPDDAKATILERERNLFKSRRDIFTKEQDALDERVESSRNILSNRGEQLTHIDEQINLIVKEIDDTSALFAKGFATQTRVLALKRQREEYADGRLVLLNQLIDSEIRLQEALIAQDKHLAAFYSDIDMQLQELEVTYQQSFGLLSIANDKMERRKFYAPTNGKIMNFKVHKPGDIIAAGSAFASLVPQNSQLIISARLMPRDSASIHEGLPARINVLAFNSRIAPTLEGEVIYVSPDVVTEEQTGQSYYPIHIKISQESIDNLGENNLQPGMPTQVTIESAKRPIISYLLDPLIQSVRGALHEK